MPIECGTHTLAGFQGLENPLHHFGACFLSAASLQVAVVQRFRLLIAVANPRSGNRIGDKIKNGISPFDRNPGFRSDASASAVTGADDDERSTFVQVIIS
jgi:hypothetical protein